MLNIIDKTTPAHHGLHDNNPEYLAIHHAASSKNFSVDDLIAFHVEKRGWEWAGYQYYIDWSGIVYQTRPDTAHGAHTPGYNDKSIGICFAGNMQNYEPSPEQKQSAGLLIQQLLDKYNIPKSNILLHRDTKKTACPGKFITKEYILSLIANPLEQYTLQELILEILRRIK